MQSGSGADQGDLNLVKRLPAEKPAKGERPTAANAALEKEFQKLLAADDAAHAQIEKLIQENDAFIEKGAGSSAGALRLKIEQHRVKVREAYKEFLLRHPQHVRALVAYASFLDDEGDDFEARDQLEKALALDPRDPAIYNNLANFHGHRGPVRKAFDYYAKAIELAPDEPVYFQNFGTTVFLFRKDAMEHLTLGEQQVFDRAMEL